MNVGERIKIIRKKNHIDQDIFSKTIGISRSTLSKIENNQTTITFDIIIKIVNNYGVSLEYLSGLSENLHYKGLNKNETSLVRNYRKLTDYQKGMIDERIKIMLTKKEES